MSYQVIVAAFKEHEQNIVYKHLHKENPHYN